MAKRTNKTRGSAQSEFSCSVPAAAVFSFLKEMSAEVSWTLDGMAKSLRIPQAETKRVAEVFELQGYIQKQANTKDEASAVWITTRSGEEVSGAKLPRYTPQHVENSLKALRERIDETNRDKNSEFEITRAVVFGDFLHGRSRLQAADVGIALEPRGAHSNPGRQGSQTQKFLQSLRRRITALNLLPFEPWMAARTHRSLM